MGWRNRQLDEVIMPVDANAWDEAADNARDALDKANTAITKATEAENNAVLKTDFVRAHGAVTTSGTGSTLTAAITNFTLKDMNGVNIKLHTDIADNAAININSLGAKAIYTADGQPIKAGAKAGSVINLVYNSLQGRFYATGASSVPASMSVSEEDYKLVYYDGSNLPTVILASNSGIGGWTSSITMPAGMKRSAAVFANNKIYITGGVRGSVIKELNIYDVVTQQWSAGAQMTVAREQHTAVYANGKIYVMGGWDGSKWLSSCEVYDMATDKWTSTKDLLRTKGEHSAVHVNGKIYVMGSIGPTNDFQKDTDIYDIQTDTWLKGADIPNSNGAAAHTAVHYGGKIYVNNLIDILGNDLKIQYIYDILTDTWTTGADIPTMRRRPGAACDNGRIHIIGGYYLYTGSLATHEIYDIASDTWSQGPDMPSYPDDFACTYGNGSIYIISGGGLPQFSNKIEVYCASVLLDGVKLTNLNSGWSISTPDNIILYDGVNTTQTKFENTWFKADKDYTVYAKKGTKAMIAIKK